MIEDTRDYNIKVSTFTFGQRKEIIQITFNVQDTEGSTRLKNFHIQRITTM